MNFSDCLIALSTYLGLDAVALADYADLDPHGGRDTGWSIDSMTRDEGRILYALTRALQPDEVIEIGTAQGCSTTHFLQAITDNPHGIVYSIDPGENIGAGIPATLRDHWEYSDLSGSDGLSLIPYPFADRRFFLEDSLHSYEHTHIILSKILTLKPTLIICHDVCEYPGVAQAWTELISDKGLTFALDGTQAGLGVYKP